MAHWQTMLGSQSRGRLFSSNKNHCHCRNLSKWTNGDAATVSGSCGSSLRTMHRQETATGEKYHASSVMYRQCRHYSDMLLSSTNNLPGPSASGPSFRGPVPPNNSEDEIVPDTVWELRTGKVRAIDILQSSLPEFFRTGLVSTSYHLPIHLHSLLDVGGDNSKGKAADRESQEEGIYARHIRLEYTPPVALPAPLPRVLSVEGLPLYIASSVFVRATLGTLYTDLEVNIHKTYIRSGTSGSSPDATTIPSAPTIDPGIPSHAPLGNAIDEDQRWSRRQLSVVIGLLVSGKSRLALSESKAEWDVECTYTFSPRSGLVALHTVNSIHPAPSETVYQALQKALSKLSIAGMGGTTSQGKGAVSMSSPKRDESL